MYGFVAIALGGCGLETITIYSAPTFVKYGYVNLTLTHNLSNNDTGFRGYDIYYRAYDKQADADAALLTIENAADLVSATPESCLNLLQSSGFTRIYDANGFDGVNGIRPVFYVGASELSSSVVYNLYLDTSASSANWYYVRTPNVASAPSSALSRSTSISGSPVSFETAFSHNDADYSGSGAASHSTIYFVFFAVGYGVSANANSFSNVYSLPGSLRGSLAYTLP